MKKHVIILVVLVLFLHPCKGQHLIGLYKDDAIKVMKEKYPEFRLNDNVVNKTFNYLKFEDKYNEETLLVFLSEGDTCTFTKLMSEYGNVSQRISNLNRDYKKESDTTWSYHVNNDRYIITYKKEEWFFSLITKKSDQE